MVLDGDDDDDEDGDVKNYFQNHEIGVCVLLCFLVDSCLTELVDYKDIGPESLAFTSRFSKVEIIKNHSP